MRRLAVAAIVLAISDFAGPLAAGPAAAEVLVNISKASQKMSVTVDGAAPRVWTVSTGRRGFSTPSGVYRPVRLERSWYSRRYGRAPMPYSIFFHKGYAVHGTIEVAQLGRAVSHGCVRLHPDNAATLFSLVERQLSRTRIVVTDAALPGAKPPGPMAHHGGPQARASEPRASDRPAPRAAGQSAPLPALSLTPIVVVNRVAPMLRLPDEALPIRILR